jgi:hypothetical protein
MECQPNTSPPVDATMDEPQNNTEGQLKSEVSWENRESLAWDEHFFAS